MQQDREDLAFMETEGHKHMLTHNTEKYSHVCLHLHLHHTYKLHLQQSVQVFEQSEVSLLKEKMPSSHFNGQPKKSSVFVLIWIKQREDVDWTVIYPHIM